MDQRGAAVIIWSCFMISIVVYIVIARNILANPRFGSGFSFADSGRIVLWILVVVDVGYLIWWKAHYLTITALLDKTKQSKLLHALESYQGAVEEHAGLVVSTYVTRRIALYAIIEALAVYGLILAVIGRYFTDQYLLSALSLLLLIFEFPGQKSLERSLADAEAGPRTA